MGADHGVYSLYFISVRALNGLWAWTVAKDAWKTALLGGFLVLLGLV